jgi:hypothetical protein
LITFTPAAGTTYTIRVFRTGDGTPNVGQYSLRVAAAPADTTPPSVASINFDFERGHELVVQFSEDVGFAIDPTDTHVGTRTPDEVTYDSTTRTARYKWAAPLADNAGWRPYFWSRGIHDASGNRGPSGLNPFSFFVLAGDANRDRAVNIQDFAVLASRFNQPGTFSQGDFNYNGITNIGDFAILAGKFNTALALPADGQADPPRPAAPEPDDVDDALPPLIDRLWDAPAEPI